MIDTQAIIDLVAREAALEPSKLSIDTELKGLGITSLDMMNVMFSVEDATGVLVEPDDMVDVATLGDLVALVTRKAAQATHEAQS